MLSLLGNTPVKSLVAPHVKHDLRMFPPSGRALQELLGSTCDLGGCLFLSSLNFTSENEPVFYYLNLKKIQGRAFGNVQGLCSYRTSPTWVEIQLELLFFFFFLSRKNKGRKSGKMPSQAKLFWPLKSQ